MFVEGQKIDLKKLVQLIIKDKTQNIRPGIKLKRKR